MGNLAANTSLIGDWKIIKIYEARMKADGYTGYYYHEQEYKCINVCLFRDTQFKLIKQEKPQN